MFNFLKSKMEGVMQRMGLVDEIGLITRHKGVQVNQSDLDQVDVYRQIYTGYYPKWHDYEWYTPLDGVKNTGRILTLNMPKIMASKMASLVYNSKVDILVTPKDDNESKTSEKAAENPANHFVHEVFSENHMDYNLQRYLEYMFGEGGMGVRTFVNDGKVKIRFATASSILPISYDSNGIYECAIVNSFKSDQYYYTFVEWHEEDGSNYIVTNELYRSKNEGTLGNQVDVHELYPKLKPVNYYSKNYYSKPLFTYFKPNIANNINPNSPLGVPLYVSAMDTLHHLDWAFNLWWSDTHGGKRKMFVPMQLLRPKIDRKTGKRQMNYDYNEEVYSGIDHDPSSGSNSTDGIHEFVPDLRVNDHITSVKGLMNLMCVQTGFSTGTFTFDEESGQAKTATEVISANSATHQTVNSHEIVIEQGLKSLIQNVLELGKASGIYTGETDVDISINFDDGVAKDRTENLQYYLTANDQQPIVSQRYAIQHALGITDEAAEQMLREIQEEAPEQGNLDDILGDNEAK